MVMNIEHFKNTVQIYIYMYLHVTCYTQSRPRKKTINLHTVQTQVKLVP